VDPAYSADAEIDATWEIKPKMALQSSNHYGTVSAA